MVISFDFKVAYGCYECLSEEWSSAIQKEEQRLRTFPRDTNFVEMKLNLEEV